MTVTRIEDARDMKAMGWPLDTPVVDGVMSKGTTMHFKAIVKAHAAFENALNEYVSGPRAGKWKLQGGGLSILIKSARKPATSPLRNVAAMITPSR